jgi:hypothetical protein
MVKQVVTVLEENVIEKTVILEVSSSPVQSINGKVGFVTIDATSIGLQNVDNTKDIDKPVSNPVLNALNQLKQEILTLVQLNVDDNINFQVELPYGVDELRVNYPESLNRDPVSIYCFIENNIDEIVYEHSISEITNEGFLITFSDFLSSDQYVLNVEVEKK